MSSLTTSPRFSLGTFSRSGCPAFAGIVFDDEQVLAVDALGTLLTSLGQPSLAGRSVLQLLEDWPPSLAALNAAMQALQEATHSEVHKLRLRRVPMSQLDVHPPVASRQIFLSGANYFKHVVDIIVDLGPGKTPGTEGMDPTTLRQYAEDMMRRRQAEGHPYMFSKPVSVLAGAYDPIVIPAFAQQPDWELELAVVIGAPARNVTREEAMSYVAGYTIANDLTNRDQIWVRGDMKAMGTDWISAKSSPGYLPVGPVIVPADQVPNPHKLHIQLKLNGEVKQDDETSDMIFDVARLIEHTSRYVQLLPGDLICTGSPAGNGTHFNRYLQPGDVVESTIAGLGTQRNLVISERA